MPKVAKPKPKPNTTDKYHCFEVRVEKKLPDALMKRYYPEYEYVTGRYPKIETIASAPYYHVVIEHELYTDSPLHEHELIKNAIYLKTVTKDAHVKILKHLLIFVDNTKYDGDTAQVAYIALTTGNYTDIEGVRVRNVRDGF